jgi:hypothetical protein
MAAALLLAVGWLAGALYASGLGRCPAEDDCWADYRDGRWVVVQQHADDRSLAS